jgi:hypothetical protein
MWAWLGVAQERPWQRDLLRQVVLEDRDTSSASPPPCLLRLSPIRGERQANLQKTFETSTNVRFTDAVRGGLCFSCISSACSCGICCLLADQAAILIISRMNVRVLR